MEFQSFFEKALGYPPYPYQIRLATEKIPDFLCVPTGAGKTAGVLTSWLYRRRVMKEDIPRRLIYCLPMRTLVEQTYEVAKQIIENLGYKDIEVRILMGGEDEEEWYLNPVAEQIIIGTQDMLISRALNRGYALSRFKWPMHFGLLNNDCFWVFDEVQLMGNTVATSAQLEAFRRDFGTLLKCKSLWLSATLDVDWFSTVDFKQHLQKSNLLELSEQDKSFPRLRERLTANKLIYQLREDKLKAIAAHILQEHQEGTLTLVICNQVKRATELYKEIKKIDSSKDVILIHSHFRPIEKRVQLKKMVDMKDAIVVSTQVIEAGVDISAVRLYTELAPYPSLIQRFGRLNRYGETNDAKCYWIDVEAKDQKPYKATEMELAKELLLGLEGKSIAPEDLPNVKLNFDYNFVIRKSEIVELFDTVPDLFGSDIDVSRFIRDSDELNLYVFWRDFGDNPTDVSAPLRDELCPVSIGVLSNFLKNNSAFQWDPIEGIWKPLLSGKIKPGLTVLLNSKSGGYLEDLGFSDSSKEVVKVIDVKQIEQESLKDDLETFTGWWESLESHLKKTASDMEEICKDLKIPDELASVLVLAAKLHDIGKAHSVFQNTLAKVAERLGQDVDLEEIWAKSPNIRVRHDPRYFRHEFVSALMLLQNQEIFNNLDKKQLNLIAYLIASHHGRVRLAVRSVPQEITRSEIIKKRICLGVTDGDIVPEIVLNDIAIPKTELSLDLIEIGAPNEINWLDISLGLLEEKGPFILAFLEALLRNADISASRREG